MVLGCTIPKPSTHSLNKQQIVTDIKSLQEYYPDSLQLTLINEPSRIVGSYSYNAGLHMRFLTIDSSHSYLERQWTDTEGRTGKSTGKWEIKDATIFIKNKYYQEVFDMIGYQSKTLLVPIANRESFVSFLDSIDELKRNYLQHHTESEWIENSEEGLFIYFSRHGIFTKNE